MGLGAFYVETRFYILQFHCAKLVRELARHASRVCYRFFAHCGARLMQNQEYSSTKCYEKDKLFIGLQLIHTFFLWKIYPVYKKSTYKIAP
jgi:hypothetical protein